MQQPEDLWGSVWLVSPFTKSRTFSLLGELSPGAPAGGPARGMYRCWSHAGVRVTCPRKLRKEADAWLCVRAVLRCNHILASLTFLFSGMIQDVYILTFPSDGHTYLCGHFGERFFSDSPVYRLFLRFYGAVPCFSRISETDMFLLFSYGGRTAETAHRVVGSARR